MTTTDHSTPLDTPDGLDRVLALSIRPVTLGLGLILLLVAAVESQTLHSPHLLSLVGTEVSVGLGLLAAYFIQRRWPMPARFASFYLLVLNNLCLMLCTAFFLFVPNPLEQVAYIVILIGQGLLFTSRRWFSTSLVCTLVWWALGCTLYQVWELPTQANIWAMFGIHVLEALCLSVVVFFVRRNSLLHLDVLRVREARQRTQLEEAMTQLQSLAQAKARFVDSVSHELRTPLTSILGYTEFLEEEMAGALNPQQHHFASQIHRGVQRLQDLVDDLLDYARIETGTFSLDVRPSNFNVKVQEVLESVRPQGAAAHLALSARLPEAPVTLPMDGQRIEQVLLNLVSNAIKFTPEGGEIVIEARVEERALRCAVVDTGMGIEPADQAKLFERFSQLESGARRGGTGLGLSIAKAIVEAHGGEIGVDSVPQQGSSFWFRLPLEGR